MTEGLWLNLAWMMNERRRKIIRNRKISLLVTDGLKETAFQGTLLHYKLINEWMSIWESKLMNNKFILKWIVWILYGGEVGNVCILLPTSPTPNRVMPWVLRSMTLYLPTLRIGNSTPSFQHLIQKAIF